MVALAFIPLAAVACDGSVETEGASCEGFDNATPVAASAVTWRIVNDTNLPLYLEPAPGCSSTPFGFVLTGPGGAVLQPQGYVCGESCETLQEHGHVACAADCAIPPVRMIPAGGTYEHVWDATHWQQTEMPRACVASTDSIGQSHPADSEMADVEVCAQRVLADAGTYEIALAAFSACKNGDELCACDAPEPDGTCQVAEVYQAELTGKQLTASISFDMPATGDVEIRFEEDLCAPSSSSPCATYQDDGCCTGETCATTAGGLTCTPPAAPG